MSSAIWGTSGCRTSTTPAASAIRRSACSRRVSASSQHNARSGACIRQGVGFDAAPFFFAPEYAAVEVALAVVRAETFHPPARNRIVRPDRHVDPPYPGNGDGGVPDRVHQQLGIEIPIAELGGCEEVVQDRRRFRHLHPLADVSEKARALALDHPAIGGQTSVLGTGIDVLANVEAAAP